MPICSLFPRYPGNVLPDNSSEEGKCWTFSVLDVDDDDDDVDDDDDDDDHDDHDDVDDDVFKMQYCRQAVCHILPPLIVMISKTVAANLHKRISQTSWLELTWPRKGSRAYHPT